MRTHAGLFILLAKLGPKIFPIIWKLHEALWGVVKSFFGVKAVGLVGSVGLYTYLFTWQMGVALVLFLGIHEYGHLWAMKRCGLKTKGMFFLPGIGAVAVSEDRWGGARNEAYIAIMGPIFGLVFFVFPMIVLSWKMADPLFAAIAAFMAFINLLNLFPINPLDGGRILKALAYSPYLGTALLITVVVSAVTAIFGVAIGFWLVAYMALLGLWEIAEEFGIKERVRHFLLTLARGAMAATLYFIVPFVVAHFGENAVGSAFGAFVLTMLAFAVFYDVRVETVNKGRSVLTYPLALAAGVSTGIMQIAGLRSEHIKAIENYPPMDTGGKTWYAASFLFLVVVHGAVIYALALVPGAELAKELLQ